MVRVFVQHKIGKWSEFERIFTADAARRKSLGSTGGTVYRNTQDPENVFVVLEWGSLEGAQKFANGLETHEAMEWATSGIWSKVWVTEKALDVDA